MWLPSNRGLLQCICSLLQNEGRKEKGWVSNVEIRKGIEPFLLELFFQLAIWCRYSNRTFRFRYKYVYRRIYKHRSILLCESRLSIKLVGEIYWVLCFFSSVGKRNNSQIGADLWSASFFVSSLPSLPVVSLSATLFPVSCIGLHCQE